MRKTIALINWKGGTCKTTVTLNAGAGLAKLGKRTLVIDLDPQGNLTYSLGIKPAELRATIAEALEGKAELEDAIIEREGMDIIPATQGLADTEARIANVTGREYLLREALGRFKRPYDFILIDGPPSLGLLTTNALAAAREAFVPLEAQALPLQGLKAIQGVIELVRQRINPGLELSGIIAAKYDGRLTLSQEVMETLRAHFGDKVFKAVIRAGVKLAEAPSSGKSIFTYAPHSHAAEDYLALCKEIIKRSN